METFEHSEKLDLVPMIPASDSIKNRLKFYRAKMHMTQEELAELAEISLSTIKRYETGRLTPNVEICKKLAHALSIPASELYDDYLIFITSNCAQAIQTCRKSKKLTQSQLADLLDVSKKTVSFWERGQSVPNRLTYKKIKSLLTKST